MEFMDFYDLAEYANAEWKGNFAQREIVNNAHVYWSEFLVSAEEGKPTIIIVGLLNLLDDDGSDEAMYYAEQIRKEIGG